MHNSPSLIRAFLRNPFKKSKIKGFVQWILLVLCKLFFLHGFVFIIGITYIFQIGWYFAHILYILFVHFMDTTQEKCLHLLGCTSGVFRLVSVKICLWLCYIINVIISPYYHCHPKAMGSRGIGFEIHQLLIHPNYLIRVSNYPPKWLNQYHCFQFCYYKPAEIWEHNLFHDTMFTYTNNEVIRVT